jgi:succinoglycan biosynthesis transport protein ExoP
LAPAVAQLSNPDPTMTQDEMVAYVLENLSIRQEKGASVLWLTYRDPDPQRAKEVLDSLATAYSQYSLKDRRSRSSTAIQFIEAKLPQIKKQLDQSALAVTKFREKYKIVDPDTYASSVYAMKQDLDKQSQQLQIQMAQTQRQFKELQRQVGGSTDLVLGKAILAEDITYQNLVKQFQEAETHYYLERTRFQDNHPEVQVAKDRRDQLYKLMQVQAETVLGGRAAQVGSVRQCRLVPMARSSRIWRGHCLKPRPQWQCRRRKWVVSNWRRSGYRRSLPRFPNCNSNTPNCSGN